MRHGNTSLSNNNFDLLRFIFASIVCLVHTYQLSGDATLELIPTLLSSALAVKAFFIVSGFLIFMSYERSASLRIYIKKRFLRIYPAYFCVVILCAFLLVSLSSRPVTDYFSFEWLKYLLANLTFLNFIQPTLPGVFETHRMPAVNGALWTLKVEVMFYAMVPMFVFLFQRVGHLFVLSMTYCLSVAYSTFLTHQASRTGLTIYHELARQLPGQLSYFMSGAFLYYFLPFFEKYAKYFFIIASILLLANRYFPLFILEPFALASFIIFFGLLGYANNFNKYGDFSYGIYILHVPIIQIFIHNGWLRDKPFAWLASTIFTILMAAVAMWYCIERHFLKCRKPPISANIGGQGSQDAAAQKGIR